MKSGIFVILAAAISSTASAQIADERKMLDALLSGNSPLEKAELAQRIEAAGEFPIGSKDNPVRVEQPAGERAYLARLRCADGNAPAFARRGSTGGGPYGTMLDLYRVDCGKSTPGTVEVVMDMYHRGHIENRAVPGFSIVPE